MFQEILRVEKKIKSNPVRLFDAWLNPDQFAKWFLSGNGITIESVALDPRPGGKFQINMELSGILLPHYGEYVTIDRPRKLVFTWRSQETQGLDTLVTVTFEEIHSEEINQSLALDSKSNIKIGDSHGKRQNNFESITLITLTHERLASSESVGKHRFGWESILDAFETWITN
ncbi:SRPBCC family protein [Leptospira sp. GIMC2001]|uniref:SRPBCC family protein n=1 Tax=Leptospira sp. GIMC2001 TaxID=1513297 RepID=UPI00234B337A|nr:SRPBCC family protein [Leptospira sp. GIMC2001]WCL49265.1 SRPBCC family protein [Leptospira sp. GIMC2001]